MTSTSAPTPEERIEAERLALQNCETQPIRTIDFVQPVGVLVATDMQLSEISHVSENISSLLGLDSQALLGTNPTELFGRETAHSIRNAAGHTTIRAQREYVATTAMASGGQAFDVSVYATNDDRLVIELVPHNKDAKNPIGAVAAAQRIIKRASAATTIDEVLDSAVDQLRHLTGYDRVKAYRFLPDGAGEIAAESRGPGIDSFLGLRFPAHDVPQSARELYATTPIRVISSVDSTQSPIQAVGNANAEPLDLGLAVLRGCVPVHTQYLQNMGVRATLSLPIVVDGEMWGLFAFHHYEDRFPDSMTIMACEVVGQSLSMMIEHLVQNDQAERIERTTALATSLLVIDDTPDGFSTYWDSAKSDLSQLIDCDGVAQVGRLEMLRHGLCPEPAAIRAILSEASSFEHSDAPALTPLVIQSFAEEFPNVAELAGGAIILRRPIPFVDAIIFFRNPVEQKVRWAGQHEKDIQTTDEGLRLLPRASFAEYIESTKGRCEDWTDADLRMATALQLAFGRAHTTGELHGAHRERLGLMVRELNHRVRNILALVSSLMRQSADGTASVDEYVSSLDERISALAAAHDLLTEHEWRPVQLSELLLRALKPYKLLNPDAVNVSGPSFTVAPDVANVLVLVVHELASNAAKYGALSVEEGQVDLTWHEVDGDITIDWAERDGPPVTANPGEGLGTSIIRNALAFEFNAVSTLDMLQTGVVAKFVLPSTIVTPSPYPQRLEVDPRPKARTVSNSLRVLIVEDDFLIAKETSATLARFDISQSQMVSTVPLALSAIEENEFDLVLLDANLNGEFSGPIATELGDRNIPFVFVTGYGSQDQELKDFAHRRILTKPLREESLLVVLSEIEAERVTR